MGNPMPNPEAVMPEPLAVSVHAEDRFVERHPDLAMSLKPRDDVMRIIRKHLERATPTEIPPRPRIQRLLKHGRPAEYLGDEGWVFVIVDRTVLTCERREMWSRYKGKR